MTLRKNFNRTKIALALSLALTSVGLVNCNYPTSSKTQVIGASQVSPEQRQQAKLLTKVVNSISGNWTCTGSGCAPSEAIFISADLKSLNSFTVQNIDGGKQCSVEQDSAMNVSHASYKSSILTVSSTLALGQDQLENPKLADPDCQPVLDATNKANASNANTENSVSLTIEYDSKQQVLTITDNPPSGIAGVSKTYVQDKTSLPLNMSAGAAAIANSLSEVPTAISP